MKRTFTISLLLISCMACNIQSPLRNEHNPLTLEQKTVSLENLQMPVIQTNLSNFKKYYHAKYEKEINPEDIKVAVLIEPRELSTMAPIIQSAYNALGDDWVIQVFHGLNNEEYIRSTFKKEIKSGRMVLSRINKRNFSLEFYNNKLMLNPYFWQNIIGEKVLNFETDSLFCNNGTTVDEFLQYDFIGAPWDPSKYRYFCYVYDSPATPNIRLMSSSLDVTEESLKRQGYTNIRFYEIQQGNSGFMLRTRAKVLEILATYTSNTGFFIERSNDIFYGCAFADKAHTQKDVILPTVETAKRFSVDNFFYNKPFGIHKPWLQLPVAELDILGQQCTGLSTFMKEHYAPKHGWGNENFKSKEL